MADVGKEYMMTIVTDQTEVHEHGSENDLHLFGPTDDGDQTPDPCSSDGRFRVTDEKAANWVVRRIAEARAYADRVRQWARDEVRRAESNEQNLLFLYGRQLEDWCRSELTNRGNRRRSINLPAGRVGFRKGRPRLIVIDEPALATWCESNMVDALAVAVEGRGEQAVRLRNLIDQHQLELTMASRILTAEVLARVQRTGEIPPGVEHEGSCVDRFFVS